MKKFLSHAAKRITPVALLSLILVAAILYQNGVYEIPFIVRSDNYGSADIIGTDTPTTPIFSGGAVENTSKPGASESLLGTLNSSSNVSDVTGPSSSDSSDTSTEDDPSLPQGGRYESFAPIKDFTSSGFSISYKDYSSSSVLAEITLSDAMLPSALYGQNKLFVEFTSATDTEDGIPYSVREFESTTAMAVELYMGYIIIDNGSVLSLFSSEGKPLGVFERMHFVPAYTRDLESNPLFYLTDYGFGQYYYFDEEARSFTLSKYNDETDNRGLYFDYTPDYGLSDNDYQRYSAIVSCIVEMTPEEAHDYTDVNTVPSTPDTTTPSDDTTTPSDDTTAPSDDTTTPSDDTTAPSDDTTAPSDDTTAPSDDTTAPSDDTTTPSGEDTTPGTDTPADTSASTEASERSLARPPRTEIMTGFATAGQFLESKSTGSVTTKYSNYTISEDGKTVYVEIMERRWAFDTANYLESEEYLNNPDDTKLSEIFKYYRLYNFHEGLCATVARNGALSFTDTSSAVKIKRDTWYYGQNDRKLLTSYREPLLKGIDSLGSLYFDRGYAVIRQVDIDSQFTDKLSGDYLFLIDKNGKKFTIPSGYDLIAYSDGVLLLEKDGYYGYYSIKGKWIAQPIYTYARPFAEGLGVIGFSGSKKGVVDTDGNLIIPFKYDYISQVSSGIMALYGDGEWTLIGKLNK